MLDFKLPQELIAQEPAHPRDHARLLVYYFKTGKIIDDYFYNIDKYLSKHTTLVVNDSKVEKCRWIFGKIEIFVLEKLNDKTVVALVRPGKKFRIGDKIVLAEDIVAEVTAINNDGHRTLRLNVNTDDPRLINYEHVPLPPYIAQNDKLAEEYQTVFADPLGSKAAPTAGLHFTDELLQKISDEHDIAKVTLHVGLGTFANPTEEQIKNKHLHGETYWVDDENHSKIFGASHVTSVGTTSTRTIESIARTDKKTDSTSIFIQPGDKFEIVDSLITNFHLPGTSLLMLVAALLADKKSLSPQAAEDELMRIYNHAIENKYRFYSFGDAMLLV